MSSISKEELVAKVEEFYRQYNYLADMIDVYHQSDTIESEMKKAGNASTIYFRIVCSACVDSFLMTLARMYDVNKKSDTIISLINECKSDDNKKSFEHPDEVSQFLTDAGRKLKKDDIRKIREILIARRNAHIAHNDKNHFVEKAPAQKNGVEDAANKLPMMSIWELTRYTGELLRYLLKELSCDTSENERIYHNEIQVLFPDIAIDFNAPV